MKSWWIPTPEGDQGIAVTIAVMRMAAHEGARDPQIRELALKIVAGVPNNDREGEISAIYHWVKGNIAFRGEHDETVQMPGVTLRFEGADCDCHAVLLNALLGSLGYVTDFKTVAAPGEKDFSHVYALVLDDSTGQWTALDTTVDEATPGWEPPRIGRSRQWGLGRNMRGYTRYRRLGQDDSGDSTGTQIADVISAAAPIVTAFAPQQQPVYVTYPSASYPASYQQNPYQPYQPQSPYQQQNTPFSPQTRTRPSAGYTLASVPWWGWAIVGFGGIALFKAGESRGRR